MRALLDLLGIALLGAFAATLTWRAALMVGDTWENGSRSITPLQTPLIMPQALWLAGWVAFCAALAFVAFGLVRAILAGDLARVQNLAGALSMEEEIEGETGGAMSRSPASPMPNLSVHEP